MKSCKIQYFWYLIALILFNVAVTNAFSQDYELVWADEFDYSGLPDTNRWDYDVGGHGWGNQELQYYTYKRSKNARVENGKLIIEARKESFMNNEYTSARLVTRNKGDWLYGKIEVKVKLPRGRGTWPAIWMLPTDWEYGGWPSSGEIDIMEHVGYDPGVVHGTVHTEAFNHTLGTQKGGYMNIPDAMTADHVYSIEWIAWKIDFFIDGNKYFTFYQLDNDYKKWPFDKRFHLILNIAIGGSWGGQRGIDDSIFPQSLEIDYIRVYQINPDLSVTSHQHDLKNESEYSAIRKEKITVFPNPFEDKI